MIKLNIVIFSDYYIPSYKAGGPIRSLFNMVNQLGNEFNFKVITRDRDIKDSMIHSEIKVNAWNSVGKAKVYYIDPKNYSMKTFYNLIHSTKHDMLYFNSFFSPIFTIKPLLLRRLGLIPKVTVIVAPRGEFSKSALGLKKFKKRLYLELAKLFGLYDSITWQASSKYEKVDICNLFGHQIPVAIAPNLPSFLNKKEGKLFNHKKAKGSLKVIFISRISRMKNLSSALKMFAKLRGKVLFNIYGPLEDKKYWLECKNIIEKLPKNIEVQYMGAIKHGLVSKIINEHDLFFLPTLGENFGHVILEALVAGCPVLISDQTPWRDLEEKGVGWDLPLNCPERFQEALQKCIDMNEQEYRLLSKRAHKFGLKIIEDKTALNQNRKLFYKAFYG